MRNDVVLGLGAAVLALAVCGLLVLRAGGANASAAARSESAGVAPRADAHLEDPAAGSDGVGGVESPPDEPTRLEPATPAPTGAPEREEDERSTVEAQAAEATLLSVSGRVVGADGSPQRAHVMLSRWNQGSLGTSTGDDGSFSFDAGNLRHTVAPGTYTLHASTDEGLVALIEIEVIDRSVETELILERGGSLRLILEGVRDRVRCRVVCDGLMLTDFTLRKGKPAVQVAPLGPTLVQLWTAQEGIVFEKTARAVAGKTLDVHLELVD